METAAREVRLMYRILMLTSVVLLAGCASGGARESDDAPAPAAGPDMESQFAGKFPGVEVSRVASGGITVRIRGATSILGSSEPLFIIDGVKVQSGPGGLLFLDPNEIRKIEVLKDIGSTAIYGSEGANGVVIITTKRAIK
jgi:TonB-dependent SusC/RagA subfamily outer membrane receptor